MKRSILLMAAISQTASALFAAEPTIYYQESFRNYRETVPFIASEHRIDNDPIWTQRAEAVFKPASDGLVFKSWVGAVPETVRDYDVLFDFRFMGEGRQFELRAAHGKEQLTVAFTPEGLKVHGAGVTADATFAAPIPAAAWRKCAVTFRGSSLRVAVEDGSRVLKTVLEAKIEPRPLSGINFHGFKGAPFGVSHIVVRDAAPLPDSSIKRWLPTPTDDASAYQRGAAQPTVTVPANDRFGATLRIGPSKDAVTMSILRDDGSTSTVSLSVAPIKGRFNENESAKRKSEDAELPDAIIQIAGLTGAKSKLDYYVRPRLRRYHTSYSYTDTYHDLIRDWSLLPKASEYPLKLEFRRGVAGTDVYLNGCLATRLEGSPVKEVTFTLAPDAGIKDVVSAKSDIDATRYLALDIAAQRMPRSFADATPTLKPGLAQVQGVPIHVASGSGSADIGLTREGQGNWALEVDEYLARSPFDGLLTEVHFTVPGAPYHKAWVLCALDPDPSKDPVLTTRLTQYGGDGIGNNLLADTTITLPRAGEKPPAGVTQVGTVQRQGKELPLYLVEVSLDVGRILDLAERPVMNLDFFGKPWENLQQIDNRSKPDPTSTSGVQLFGVTLEKSPMTLALQQSQPGNVFHNDEKRQTTAIVRALAPGKGKLTWEMRDVDGKPVGRGESALDFTAAEQTKSVTIDLDQPRLGWYELLLSLHNEEGRTLFTHPARFALLGKDTRQAGYESPYGTWWFDGAHSTPASLDFAGPIMFKAGIRKAAWTKQTEAAMAKWSITQDQVNMPFEFKDLKDPEKAKVAAKKKMDDHLAKYPHLREILVYHESGPGNDLPLELFGVKPEMTDALVQREKKYADLFNLAGSFFRENYPHLKLVVGNNSAAQSCIAAIFRHGGKPEYMDFIGIESPSQVFIPEKLQEWAIQGHHISSDTAEVLSGKRIPATGCYEFTYRCERDMGEHQQAEWYTRDVLISLGNNFTRIGPGILFDTANSYHNGLWGASGILQRAPWGYPKKSYVAYATITNVLDRVKLRRQVETGSTTVYALEFDRADGKVVTALWTARGEAEWSLDYSAATPVEIVDMYGRAESKPAAQAFTVTGGTAPVYVVADKPLAGVRIAARRFAKDDARAAHATIATPLDRADLVSIDADSSLDTPIVAPLQLPVRQHASAQVRQVTDDQKGEAIELQLDPPAGKTSKYVTHYTTLRLKQPASVAGEPAALGVWVKGNSNWGRVLFEIQDAEGETWRSVGTGGWGCDVLDWPGNAAVNFDGWNFVSLPLRDSTLFNDHSPGPVLEQWVSGGGNKRIDYPIKVSALIVEMNPQSLDLVDFKPKSTTLRLRDLSGIADPARPTQP